MRTATRRTARDGIGNRAELLFTTRFAPLWNLVQANGLLRRSANRRLVDRAIQKMAPRPDPLSTQAPYTSWASLTDRRYDGRHLGPVLEGLGDLPSAQQTAELFRRPGETVLCPKSTVLFAYLAQWFTDGFLRSDRARDPDPRENDSTHEIDLCQIYGLTQQATEELRAGELGLLESQTIDGEEFPPYLYADGRKRFPSITVAREEQIPAQRRGDLFAIGTDTANVQIGHVMLNVLFLREHNRNREGAAPRAPGMGRRAAVPDRAQRPHRRPDQDRHRGVHQSHHSLSLPVLPGRDERSPARSTPTMRSQALTNPLLAPRVFHPRTVSALGWHTIATMRNLADILHRNVPPRGRPYLVTMTRTDWRRR